MKKQVPNYIIKERFAKTSEYALCIPLINEGERIKKQLAGLLANKINEKVDIIMLDGGSTDGSLDDPILEQFKVRTLLTKDDNKRSKMGGQIRMGFDYCLKQGYKYILNMDGNNKDNPEAIFKFIEAFEQGYELIQGSRYIKGGQAINTPVIRHYAVKLLHVPLISKAAGFKYTDTTNNFRGYSAKLIADPRINVFRDVFNTYEIIQYLSVKPVQLGYKVTEVPTIRAYPKKGKTPTKISFFKGNADLFKILINTYKGKYDPGSEEEKSSEN